MNNITSIFHYNFIPPKMLINRIEQQKDHLPKRRKVLGTS